MSTISFPLARILLGLAALVFALPSCGNDFDPASKITDVRVLAARAEPPYVRPEETAVLTMLAVDGRPAPTPAMQLSWVPVPCVNPPGGDPLGCYPLFDALYPRHVDLTDRLVAGASVSLSVPSTALADSTTTQSGTPFGTVFAFGFACAGHVELVGPNASRPRASPFVCLDASGAPSGSDAFVFAYARLFVFADRRNENPVIEGWSVDGRAIDPGDGLVVDRCATPSKKNEDPTCPTRGLDVRVSQTSQEEDPSYLGDDGRPLREDLWVDYYATGGKLKNDVRVLFDPKSGRANSSNVFEAPSGPGETRVWAVVHDNRGGVAWADLPVLAR